MTGCKRTAILLLTALWAATAQGAEQMRILTFVPGVAQGRLPVTVDLGSAPPPAELLLDGKSVCRVTSRRQTCTVDLGPAPHVHLLELVRRGSAGPAERVRRWVNKPSVARAEVLPRTDCVKASGPCTLSVAWSHEQDLDPALLSVSIDGKKAYEGPPKNVAIPFAAEKPVRVVAVDLSFVDGQRASETLLIGSGTSSAVEAPLNAVVVSTRGKEGAARPAPATLGGRAVRAAEPGESDLLFFVAPSAVPKLLALEAGAQKSFSKTNSRLAKVLDGVTHVIHFSPLATRTSYRTASEVSDRLFRLQGFDCTPGSGHRELILPCVDASVLTGGQYRLAATVTSGAFVRAATPRRRVAVVVLGDGEPTPDESAFGPAEARAYLSEIFVPLAVWRLGRAGGGAWGEGRRVSTPQEFVDAFAALRAELDAQQICWVAEDLDPASFRLAAADEGLVLAGRGAGAEPLVVASAAEPEEPGAPVASAAAAPGKGPSKKSVAASQEVGLVNLDAFVADGKGKRVTGLKASDFTLRVGGKPVAITNFSEYAPPAGAPLGATSLAPPAPGETAAAPAERPRRRAVIFVDRLTLGDQRRSARFFGSLKDFVVRTIQPGDEIAVLSFDETLATRVAFTGDTFAVLKALDVLAKESARPPVFLTGVETSEKLVAEIAQAEAERAAIANQGRAGAAPLPAPPTGQPVTINSTVLAEMRGLAAQEWGRTKNKVASLKAVLTALGGLDGRRVLVVASHRLSRWSGMEHFLTKRLDVDVQVPADAREFDARQLLLDLSEAANAYGVTLHGLYPEAGGDFDLSVMQASVPQFTGQTMNGRRGIWIDANESEGLHLAVDPTGGVVGLGAEQAGDALKGAATDLESFYSLGFPVEGLIGGKPLEIDLKVSAAGARVRTRRAVALRSAVDRATDRTVSNLFSTVASPGFPITARATSTTPAEKGRVQVAYEITIPAASLALLPAANARVAKIAAFVALLDRGDVTQAAPVRQEFKTGEDAFADAEGIFTFTGTAVVNPGAVISIGILDEATQESGYARIEVPAAAKK